MSDKLFEGVDISDSDIIAALDLPSDAILVDSMRDNRRLIKKFIFKYWKVFKHFYKDTHRSELTMSDLASFYKRMVEPDVAYVDDLSYARYYPESTVLLYIASAFKLMKVRPSFMWESTCNVKLTLRGKWYCWIASRKLV